MSTPEGRAQERHEAAEELKSDPPREPEEESD